MRERFCPIDVTLRNSSLLPIARIFDSCDGKFPSRVESMTAAGWFATPLIPLESATVYDIPEIEEHPLIAGVILAAGGSERLGQPKQLIDHGGVPLVVEAVKQAIDYCDAGLTVVTGARHDDVANVLDHQSINLIHNSGWGEGMGSSIRRGVASASSDANAILLLVCDQPFLSAADIGNLVDAWKARPDRIAAAGYAGTQGVPAIFPAVYRESLLDLRGDRGARGIIEAAPAVSIVDMPNAQFDIDTPADLEKL
jgi:molybdenum cofactor cytidylyltransferase